MKHSVAILSLFLLGLAVVRGAPCQVSSLMPACLTQDCDLESGPVCLINEMGTPISFPNSCLALVESCKCGTFFAEVKPGEC